MSEIVTGMTHKGEGVIRIEGKVCFVPGAIPGEEIEICHVTHKKNFSRAQLQSVQKPSPFRVTPPCPNTAQCGGCVWQHVAYEKQLVFKRDIIAQQIQRLAGLDVEVRPVMGMEHPEKYRNKVTWHCTKNAEKLTLGFFNEESHQTAPLTGCLLPTEAMLQVGSALEKDPAFYGLKAGDDVVVRQSSIDQTLLIAIYGNPVKQKILQLVQQFPNIKTLCAIHQGKTLSLYGEPFQMQHLAGCDFQISAPSFFQTNPIQTEKLYQEIRRQVGEKPQVLLDAFCGAGTISCMLAKDGHTVTGIESNPFAIEDAKKNARRNQVNPSFLCAPCEKGIAQMQQTFDTIVLDPPRSGCYPATLTAIIDKQPQKIVYVSCEPSTLARDLKILHQAGYQPKFVQPVDMFPYTSHVETVCLLSRNK